MVMCEASNLYSSPSARTTGPEFYKEAAEAIRLALARLDAIDVELTAAYDRWHTLDARA